MGNGLNTSMLGLIGMGQMRQVPQYNSPNSNGILPTTPVKTTPPNEKASSALKSGTASNIDSNAITLLIKLIVLLLGKNNTSPSPALPLDPAQVKPVEISNDKVIFKGNTTIFKNPTSPKDLQQLQGKINEDLNGKYLPRRTDEQAKQFTDWQTRFDSKVNVNTGSVIDKILAPNGKTGPEERLSALYAADILGNADGEVTVSEFNAFIEKLQSEDKSSKQTLKGIFDQTHQALNQNDWLRKVNEAHATGNPKILG
ncbi:MAG: hypothetical protein ACK551_02825 [Vampirovibrionales bacterium]